MKRLILLITAITALIAVGTYKVAAQWVGPPSSGGGGGGSSTYISGTVGINVSTPQGSPVLSLATPVAAANGGNGTVFGQPGVDELGTIANNGTATCVFTNSWLCHFTAASGAAITLAAPTGVPAAGQTVEVCMTQAASAGPTITFNSVWKMYDAAGPGGGISGNILSANSEVLGVASTSIFQTNSTTGVACAMWDSDGTNLVLRAGSTTLNESRYVHTNNVYINGFTFVTPSGSGPVIVGASIGISGGGANAVAVTGGGLISVTGGTPPTLTAGCNSTGSGVVANANCTANTTPFSCCTGSGAGTCPQSTDNRGIILSQSSSAVTTCTLTFNHTWPQRPVCMWSDANASTTPKAYSAGATSTTTAVVDFASGTSQEIAYHCE